MSFIYDDEENNVDHDEMVKIDQQLFGVDFLVSLISKWYLCLFKERTEWPRRELSFVLFRKDLSVCKKNLIVIIRISKGLFCIHYSGKTWL